MAHVKEIWRYPVKSMGGEQLKMTELAKGGIHMIAAGRCVTRPSRPFAAPNILPDC